MTDLVKQAVYKQIKIMEEQQQKSQELIGKKVAFVRLVKPIKLCPTSISLVYFIFFFDFNYQFVVENVFYCL